MTPDEEAAYVREVASQKTAALRMSLDAVERQHMPFVGETGGGSAAGGAARRRADDAAGDPVDAAPADRRRTAAPDRAACRPIPASPSACRGAPRGRRAPRPRGAARAPPGPDAAVSARSARSCPRSAARARSRRRTRSPRDYLLLALRLDQRMPGPRRRLFRAGRRSRRRSTWSSCARRRGCARTRVALRDRVPPREVGEPDRRDWLTAQLVALEAHAAVLAGEACRTSSSSTRSMGFAPPRHDDARVRAAPLRTLDALLPGDGPLDGAAGRLGRARSRSPVDRLPAVVDWLVERFRDRAAARLRPARRRGSARLARHGQPWSGYYWYDGGRRSRVDINVDLPVRAPDLVATIAHETYPGPPPRARLEGGRPGRRAGPPRGLDPADQHARMPHQRGPGRPGDDVRGRRPRTRRPARGAVRPGRARRRRGSGGGRATSRSVPSRSAGPRRTLAADPRQRRATCATPTAGRTRRSSRTCGTSAATRRTLAAKRLEFIEHPLWRTYVFVYAEGEALLARWLERSADRTGSERFGRLLHEQLTPLAILGDIG